MKTKIIKAIGLGIMYSLFTSCMDFETIDTPNNQMISEDVFNDERTARAAMVAVYADMRLNGFFNGNATGAGCLFGCLTDELVSYTNIPDSYQAFYNLQLTSNSKTVRSLWQHSYRQIYMCNAVLEGVEKSIMLDEDTKRQLKGEALFTRALLHFYLTNTFGDIPYVTTTNYNVNKVIGKTKIGEVYAKLAADLENAELLLPVEPNMLRTYPYKGTAIALLSRIYLFSKEYDKAYAKAESLLTNQDLGTLQPLDAVFLKESKGTLWQFAPPAPNTNTLEGAFYILITAPSTKTALQPDLVNQMSIDDLRKNKWIASVTGTITYYFPFKYKERKATSVSKEYAIIFRMEEQYLIAAEAAVNRSQLETANNWLRIFKESRGMVHEYSNNETVLMDDIEAQRKLEFFTEFGHRFYDLKRWDKLHTLMPLVKANWNVRYEHLPIPQTELQLNPNLLPQNVGY